MIAKLNDRGSQPWENASGLISWDGRGVAAHC